MTAGALAMDAVTCDDEPGTLAYAVVVCTIARAPILARQRLMRMAADTWAVVVPKSALLACAVLPDQTRAVIETRDRGMVHRWVNAYKVHSQARLLQAIRRFYADALLDMVTRYTPVWAGVVYRVWQPGYHLQEFLSAAEVTKKVGALHNTAWYTVSGKSGSGGPASCPKDDY